MNRSTFILQKIATIFIGFAMLFVTSAFAGENTRINRDENNIAIDGYDSVAYFTQRQPIEGSKQFSHVWQDAKWQFSSAKHRDMFADNPERYAPRYGGFCVMAMASGLVYKVNPKEFRIIKGKLYLNYSKKYSDQFDEDPDTAIDKADQNWVGLGKTH